MTCWGFGGEERSYEEQSRGTLSKALSPVYRLPSGCTCLTEEVSFTPNTFHSGPRLDEVSKGAVTSESAGEVLTLSQVIRHAPCDINGEYDCLVDLSGGHVLNQPNDVRDRSRNLVDTCTIITA
jgi:hypothetical protein